MAFDESINGYSLLDCTLRVPEFSLGTLTWLIVLVDYLDWGFWHSDFLCASLIYFVWDIWHVDYDDWFVLIEDSEIAIFSVLHCHIRLGYWHADCIDCLSYFAQHSDSDICHDYSDRLACMDSSLVWFDMSILWLAYYLDRLLSMMFISLFILIVVAFCVDMSDISCTLLDCMTRDCLPSAWLHVVCLCGSHFYPPTSNSLGVGHSFHLGSHYCRCETFCVLALWPSQRLGVGSNDGLYRCTGAFWRRATLWCQLESDHWRPI